jgi:hypothetical protein
LIYLVSGREGRTGWPLGVGGCGIRRGPATHVAVPGAVPAGRIGALTCLDRCCCSCGCGHGAAPVGAGRPALGDRRRELILASRRGWCRSGSSSRWSWHGRGRGRPAPPVPFKLSGARVRLARDAGGRHLLVGCSWPVPRPSLPGC